MRRALLALLVPVLVAAKSDAADVAKLEADARDAFRAGDYVTAARLFGDILTALPATDPTRARTQYNRGRALQEAGRSCAAAEALFGYLSNPVSESRRERRRKAKAQANLERARTACDARKARADAPAPVAPRAVATVEPDAPGAWVAHAGLGTGVHLTDTPERARSTAQIGVGRQVGGVLWEAGVEIAIESPSEGTGLVLLRPGLRVDLAAPLYWRASVPILVDPLFAAGLHGGVGLAWPKDGQLALLSEVGFIGWLADPAQITLDGRLGVQGRF